MPQDGPYVKCDCAHVPPTMPTARSEHLYDCPVAAYRRLAAAQVDGSMAATFEGAGRAFREGDTDALAEIVSRDAEKRAKAAALRVRAGKRHA